MSIYNTIRKFWKKLYAINNDLKYQSLNLKETFNYIYAENIWGKADDEQFYSGGGSHDAAFIEPYCNMIKKFIVEHNITEICDLGCGDFHVAAQYVTDSISYIGVDIVDEMIDHHNENYSTDKIHFRCLNIVEEDLPDAELCLIRQVLQHLSNGEVQQILSKLKKYKYVIITEHVTDKKHAKKFNIDKVHGNHTRVERQSGLYFDEEPFNLKIEMLQQIPYGRKEYFENLESILIKNDF